MPVLSISQKLADFPPVLCRLLARESRGKQARALTTAEIAERSKLSLDVVSWLSSQTAWEHIPTGLMLSFSKGCNVDFDSRTSIRAKRQHLARTRGIPAYLLRSPEYKSTIEPLLRLLTST